MSGLRKIVTSLHWSGLLVASLLWAVNTQLGQILPYLDCQHQARYSATISFLGAAVACLSGAISWRSIGHTETSEPRHMWVFVGSISVLAALVFAFALSMQGLAGLVLDGCER
jgi:drug/metabolite transporter (DMT)-like permease